MTEISRECFCSEGSRKFFLSKNKDCKEVPLNRFGRTIKTFIDNWDTQGLSPFQMGRERLIWEKFLMSDRNSQGGSVGMRFQRKDSASQYCVAIEGENMGDFWRVIQASFSGDVSRIKEKGDEQERLGNPTEALAIVGQSLKEKRIELMQCGFPTRDKILVVAATSFDNSVSIPNTTTMVVDTATDIIPYFQKNIGKFHFSFIDPLMPHYFALAPTLTKMTQWVDAGSIVVSQSFREAPKESDARNDLKVHPWVVHFDSSERQPQVVDL